MSHSWGAVEARGLSALQRPLYERLHAPATSPRSGGGLAGTGAGKGGAPGPAVQSAPSRCGGAAVCPVLGVPLAAGSQRSSGSPSLDRIRPAQGYVRGNVRVISDRANRLKGACTQEQARERAQSALPPRRPDLEKIAAYIEREELLAEVRRKAAQGGRAGAEWEKVAIFLDRAFVSAEWLQKK